MWRVFRAQTSATHFVARSAKSCRPSPSSPSCRYALGIGSETAIFLESIKCCSASLPVQNPTSSSLWVAGSHYGLQTTGRLINWSKPHPHDADGPAITTPNLQRRYLHVDPTQVTAHRRPNRTCSRGTPFCRTYFPGALRRRRLGRCSHPHCPTMTAFSTATPSPYFSHQYWIDRLRGRPSPTILRANAGETGFPDALWLGVIQAGFNGRTPYTRLQSQSHHGISAS